VKTFFLHLKTASIFEKVVINTLLPFSEYLLRLNKDIQSSVQRLNKAMSSEDLTKITDSLSIYNKLEEKCNNYLKNCLENMVELGIKPRLRANFQKCFRAMVYMLTEAQFEEQDVNDLFARSIIVELDRLLRAIEVKLSTFNYAYVVNQVQVCLIEEWERCLWQSKFNQLGALRFDKDLRIVTAHLREVLGVTTLPRFTKISQICLVLNSEDDAEIDEWRKSGVLTLNMTQIRKLQTLQGWQSSSKEILKHGG